MYVKIPSPLPSILGRRTVSIRTMHTSMRVDIHYCIFNNLLHEKTVIQM